MTRTTLLFVLGLVWAAPSFAEQISYSDFLQRNNANSAKLSVGMTKEQVLNTMGSATTEVKDGPISNPWRVEAFLRGEDTYEILYYLSRKHPPFTPIRESQAISVVIKNGGVVAWGRGAHRQLE